MLSTHRASGNLYSIPEETITSALGTAAEAYFAGRANEISEEALGAELEAGLGDLQRILMLPQIVLLAAFAQNTNSSEPRSIASLRAITEQQVQDVLL